MNDVRELRELLFSFIERVDEVLDDNNVGITAHDFFSEDEFELLLKHESEYKKGK